MSDFSSQLRKWLLVSHHDTNQGDWFTMKYMLASIFALALVGCGGSQNANVSLDQEATAKAWSATDEVLRDGAKKPSMH